jgi:hypothetical protein
VTIKRYYSSTAERTTIPAGCSAVAGSFDVGASVGFPSSYPWTGIIDADLATEEVVTVTNRAGNTLTVTRGQDGTTGVIHGAGATFQHGFSARDFAESIEFINGVVLNTQTANYILAIDDPGKTIEMNVGTANTLTIPPNGTINLPLYTSCDVVQIGAGQTTITPGAGVTLLSSGGKLKLTGQYSSCSLYQRAANTWVVIGDLSA